jgi:hypothetical protein
MMRGGQLLLMRASWIPYHRATSLDKRTSTRDKLSPNPKLTFICNSVIQKLITREKKYLLDLDFVESDFIKPLRTANPPVLPIDYVEDFIDEVFGNILNVRECSRRLLEVMYVHQREEGPNIGGILLEAATEFSFTYPTYIGHYPFAEKRLKEEMEANSKFRLFLDVLQYRAAFITTSLKLLRSSAVTPPWRTFSA